MPYYHHKYYAVFVGRNPGVYDNPDDAMEQVDGYEGALFKSYDSSSAATEAYRKSCRRQETTELGQLLKGVGDHTSAIDIPASSSASYSDLKNSNAGSLPKVDYFQFPEIDLNGWAVDASCQGNPGVMEYRGVELMTGREIFRIGPFKKGTNNIGEFLAIVHALALMAQKGEKHTVYSDSVSGMAWVRNKKIKTQLQRDADTEPVFKMMERALIWLNTHHYDVKIRKWDTDRWGEVPADFGRK